MATTHISDIVRRARERLEHGEISKGILVRLYGRYTDVGDVSRFVNQAIGQFPRLSCGLASVYLQHRLRRGAVVRGKYGSHPHTFLLLGKKTIIDITADQYGGPSIYIGKLRKPWLVS